MKYDLNRSSNPKIKKILSKALIRQIRKIQVDLELVFSKQNQKKNDEKKLLFISKFRD